MTGTAADRSDPPFEDIATARVRELADGLDLDTFAAAFTLFRLSTRVIQDLEANVHRPRGLSIAGFRVLFTVWVFGELEPRRIAALSGVSRAAVSGVLNTLEGDGLAERSRDQDDRRLVTVRVTTAGEDLLRDAYRAQNERERDLFAPLTPAELREFTALMRRLLGDDRLR